MSNSEHKITLTVDANGYSYSGGNDGGNGDAKNKIGKGAAPMHITLDAPKSYKITDVEFSGSGVTNLSFKIQNDKKVKIENSCTSEADVKYSVIVMDTATGNTTLCDPRVVNN